MINEEEQRASMTSIHAELLCLPSIGTDCGHLHSSPGLVNAAVLLPLIFPSSYLSMYLSMYLRIPPMSSFSTPVCFLILTDLLTAAGSSR